MRRYHVTRPTPYFKLRGRGAAVVGRRGDKQNKLLVSAPVYSLPRNSRVRCLYYIAILPPAVNPPFPVCCCLSIPINHRVHTVYGEKTSIESTPLRQSPAASPHNITWKPLSSKNPSTSSVRTRPPTPSDASSNLTENPPRVRMRAHTNPATPAPIIAT